MFGVVLVFFDVQNLPGIIVARTQLTRSRRDQQRDKLESC